MRDFDSELVPTEGHIPQVVKGPSVGNDSGSKDCVNLPSPTAVFRIMNCEWQRLPTQDVGILCGADQAQEWLLPWWWSRYRDHHDLPVTFCDFGMSQEMKEWCAARGELVSIAFDPSYVVQKKDLAPEIVECGESAYGQRIWVAREHWFKKPFALLHSPYKTALWIDVDCEILGSLTSLFSVFNPLAELALVRELRFSDLPVGDPDLVYNGGVILFRNGSSLVTKWARACLDMNHRFLGDDQVLSHLIYLHGIEIQELSEIYNWRYTQWLNLNAVVVHWMGEGKQHIRRYGGLKPQVEAFLRSLTQPSDRRSP